MLSLRRISSRDWKVVLRCNTVSFSYSREKKIVNGILESNVILEPFLRLLRSILAFASSSKVVFSVALFFAWERNNLRVVLRPQDEHNLANDRGRGFAVPPILLALQNKRNFVSFVTKNRSISVQNLRFVISWK